ncbi:MAG: nucleotide sugar dehydrogenase [Thermoleophilia bacterium]
MDKPPTPSTPSPHAASPHAVGLLARIEDRTAVVGVIGQGYVGLPLALVFVEAGFRVFGFDLDQEKIASLERGESYIRHIGPERVAAARTGAHPFGGVRFTPTADLDHLAQCDCVLICVPTPLGRHREPDLSYVLDTTREIAARLHPGQLVVLESTTYPGTTDEEVRPLLEATGLRTGAGTAANAGKAAAAGAAGATDAGARNDFFLAFSPEREDPGNVDFSTRTIPKLVGGVDAESTQVATALYAAAVEQVVPLSSSRVAEAAKLLENIYRSVNIALVNELKMTFDPMGIDIYEVIEAAKTKPFGYQAFYPGPGLGGHCIPLDPFYLSWKASEYGEWTRFINLAGEINNRMPAWVLRKVQEALNEEGKSLKGAKVLVLGLSYKPDIDDDRESPSYEIIGLLRERGAEVAYCDPYFPEMPETRRHQMGLRSVTLSAEEFSRYDCLVLSTAHADFKQPALYGGARLVVDTRNVVRAGWTDRVVRA